MDGDAEEEKLRCRRYLAGVVIYRDGIPVAFRRRCDDSNCCERRDGHRAFHVWTISGGFNGKARGEYITVYLPFLSAADLLGEPSN